MKTILSSLGAGALMLGGVMSGYSATHTVLVSNFAFSPATLSIAQGDSVLFTNTTATAHTTTSGSSCTANSLWNSSLAAHAAVTINYASFTPGTYPFFCVPHCAAFGMVGSLTVTNAPNTPPIVSLSSPTNGAGYLAPANFTLTAIASDPGGSVTNVEFFSGAVSMGSVPVPPYNLPVTGLPAGNYSFAAVASDNLGAKTASATAAVSVFTNTVLSAPVWVNGHLQLTLQAIPGQTYSLDSSSNLLDWVLVNSGIAPVVNFDMVDPLSSTNDPAKFYRARQNF
ncbi:MAG: Ig-like domain-containing protein [Verrucomicrobiota bacterium]